MLVSFGDLIIPGRYYESSRFSKAVNYINSKMLVSLVLPVVKGGPLNVVLKKLPSQSQNWLEVKNDTIEMSGEKIFLEKGKMYDSRIKVQISKKGKSEMIKRFRDNLKILKWFIEQKAHPMSYAFLLIPERKRYFASKFEKALVERVERGWNEILNSNYKRGVELIKGTGTGFTPSGDDFIAGILSGLYLIQSIFNVDFLQLRKIIYLASRTGNIVSDSYTYCAFRGYFFESVKKILQVIVIGEKEDVEKHILTGFSYGLTSGADFLTGIAISLKFFSHT